MVTIVVYTGTGQVGFSGSPIMHRQTHRLQVYYLLVYCRVWAKCDKRGISFGGFWVFWWWKV